ncbi:PEP-CTERM sorting domain-containing protein [Cerasicoccus arenae]|uniref:PEP-CTERM sorting domain-containing protein n=1 Tax=Cerasicoccus arenae TaxID=424488 RepID=A0A8J3GE41_9BACT|nr:PEP-CTERM sorting domain-containing protein [Cerasicoccus arenae]MBK1858045.1 PEP-CTERM sorting domain-containing protein [Cerasicoccus arenae]GHC06711.1 hypothetical protein GCM10007047_24680 [Cerasicoccus arenae]
MKILSTTFLALFTGLTVSSANGAVIFYDDMESYPLGNDQDVSSSPKLYLDFGIADQTTATPFGSPNQFAFLDGGSSFSRVNSVSTLMTYSFDMYEPTTAQTGPTRFGLGQGDVNSNAYAAWSIDNGVLTTLDNTSPVSGSLPTLEQDRHYTAYIVHNGSDGPEVVDGTGLTLQAGETSLYFYDTVTSSLIDAGVYSHSGSKLATSFLVRSFGADDNTLYYDNITQLNTLTVIPEPSAYAGILGGAVLLCMLRRRSMKAK